jgi:hypothetical protein
MQHELQSSIGNDDYDMLIKQIQYVEGLALKQSRKRNIFFHYTRNLPVNFSQVEEVADSDHTDVTQLAPASLSQYLNLVIDGALIVRLGHLAEPIR